MTPLKRRSITSRFRDWRIKQDYTLEEVSGLAGLSVPMLSRVERGERSLLPATKVRVARRLGVSVRDLFDVEPIAEEESTAS